MFPTVSQDISGASEWTKWISWYWFRYVASSTREAVEQCFTVIHEAGFITNVEYLGGQTYPDEILMTIMSANILERKSEHLILKYFTLLAVNFVNLFERLWKPIKNTFSIYNLSETMELYSLFISPKEKCIVFVSLDMCVFSVI